MGDADTAPDGDLTVWRLEQLEEGQVQLRETLRAQGEAMKFNREQEVTEHTAIRKEIVALGSEFSGRLWSAAAAVIIAVVAPAVVRGLFG